MKLWKDFDNGNLSLSLGSFADSVEIHTADGSIMKGHKDSVMKNVQGYRDMFSSTSSDVHALIPLRSTDKNEDWVTVWGTEHHTWKNGKIDSVHLQETWRFNKDGKVDFMMQYERATTAPKR